MSAPSLSPSLGVNDQRPSESTGGSAWWSRLGALLVIITSVPAAVLVIPNTMSYVVAQAVRDLGLPAAQAPGMVRAAGLALPALLLAVPLAAVLARRVPAAIVLIAGLGAVLGGEIAAEFTGSIPALGAVPTVGVL